MNKKIIIALVAVITVSVGSFVGINAYKNSKQEVPQKTIEIENVDKVTEDDKEKAPTEEQKKDTEVVLDAEKAQVVFQNLHNVITNIDYKDAEQVKKQEEVIKETTHSSILEALLKKYNEEGKKEGYKAELISLNITELKPTEYKLESNKYNGYEIIYNYTVKVDNNKEYKLENMKSLIILDSDSKYKIAGYDYSSKK